MARDALTEAAPPSSWDALEVSRTGADATFNLPQILPFEVPASPARLWGRPADVAPVTLGPGGSFPCNRFSLRGAQEVVAQPHHGLLHCGKVLAVPGRFDQRRGGIRFK